MYAYACTVSQGSTTPIIPFLLYILDRVHYFTDRFCTVCKQALVVRPPLASKLSVLKLLLNYLLYC